MSYILEALKKAQAERQLGHAPDIHAPAPGHVPAAAARANRKPLLIGLSVGIVLAGVAGALIWKAQGPVTAPRAVLAGQAQGGALADAAPAPSAPLAPVPAAPAPIAASASAPAPALSEASTPRRDPHQASGGAQVAAAAPSAPERPVAAAPSAEPALRSRPATQPDQRSAPSRNAPAPAVVASNGSQAVYLPAPALLPAPSPAPTPVPAPAAIPTRAPDPVVVARAPELVEDNLRTLQQLPEAIQREVPRVSVGGYIYSPNPADRLLLVDKTLRREGEELAPGLVLERLMPKYAVMNYRGTRYRVGY